MGSHRYQIVSIVEGAGEVSAVPALVTRWLKHRKLYDFTADLALRANGEGNLCAAPYEPGKTARNRQRGVEYFVRLAVGQGADAILVLLDADDKCIRRARDRLGGLGPELLRRARAEAAHVPVGVVVADRMFEAWYLSEPCLEALRVAGRIAPERWPRDPAALAHKAGCKGTLEGLLGSYSPVPDQRKLSAHLEFTDAFRAASRSYAKLLRELERLTNEARARRTDG